MMQQRNDSEKDATTIATEGIYATEENEGVYATLEL